MWKLLFVILMATQALADNIVESSLSIRTPKQEYREENGIQIANPIDYEVMVGFADTEGWGRGHGRLITERQNGKHYLGVDLGILVTTSSWDTGLEVENSPDSRYFHSAVHASKKLFNGHLGIGTSRQYTRRWFNDGAWMFRITVQHNEIDFLAGTSVKIKGVVDLNADRCRASYYMELIGIGIGELIRVVPFWKLDLIGTELDVVNFEGKWTDRIQVKIKVEALL